MRVFFSFLSVWSLGISLLFAIFDIARSVAQFNIHMLSLQQFWRDYLPEYWSGFMAFIKGSLGVGFWDYWCLPLLNMPGALFFLILSVLLFVIGNLVSLCWRKQA